MGGSGKRWAGLVMVLMYLLLSISAANAQRITGQSASEAFSKGDFSNAFEQYSTLLGSFPRDPAYLYGAGVSLIRLAKKPEEATELLSRAVATSSSVRSAPADARFYLARALHMSGRFDEAVREYEKYASEAGRREARDRGIAELIEQCNNGSGMLTDGRPAQITSVNQTVSQPLRLETVSEADPVELPPAIRVTLPDTLPEKTDYLLSGALRMRANADAAKVRGSDSLLILAGVPVLQDKSVRTDMTRPVMDAANRPSADSVTRGAKLRESVVTGRDTLIVGNMPTATVVRPVQPSTDTSEISKQVPIISDTNIGETNKVTPPLLQPARKDNVTSLFDLKDPPHYSPTNQVTVSTAFPPGLLYTVQLAVFRNPVEPSHFKRLYPVFGVKIPGRELTTYYSGLFRTMADASKSLQSIRNEGFRDAFITIFMDGKAVSAERGAILEKEWGAKGLPEWAGVVPVMAVSTVAPDTVPPTLLFRVEVLRSARVDNKQLTDEISRVAGDRGFEIMNPATGIYVYIVGKFLTFETASAYADLLRRNGYKEAKVAAYAGNREIPVETALKLFERKN